MRGFDAWFDIYSKWSSGGATELSIFLLMFVKVNSTVSRAVSKKNFSYSGLFQPVLASTQSCLLQNVGFPCEPKKRV